MSTPERDPRVDPRPGDVLRVGPPVIITGTDMMCVRWKSPDLRSPVFRCRQSAFRQWASSAQVIRKGEE